MSKTCKMVFLDENGNKHGAYYGNLETLGHKGALQEYLKAMLPYSSVKFSKDTSMSFDDLIAKSNNYIKNKPKAPGFSKIVNNFRDHFEEDKAAGNQARRMLAANLQEKATGEKVEGLDNVEQEYLAEADNKFGITIDSEGIPSGNTEFTKLRDNIKSQWEAKQEGGTKIHNVLEEFANVQQERGKENRNENIAITMRNLGITGGLKDTYERMINSVWKAIDEQYSGRRIRWESEVVLYDEGMDAQGIIDLLGVDLDTGELIPMDYKVKEEGQDHKWENERSPSLLGEGLSGIRSNPANLASLQQAMYKLMLERSGFAVATPQIIKLHGKLAPNQAGKMYYETMKVNEIVPTFPFRSEIIKTIESYNKDVRGKDTPLDQVREYEDGKINDHNELLTAIVPGDKNLFGRSRDGWVQNKLDNRRSYTTKSGKKVTEVLESTSKKGKIILTGKDPKEWKKQLEAYYDKNIQNKDFSTELIKFFNNDKKRYASGIKAKSGNMLVRDEHYQRQANDLLKGIDKANGWTLERANSIPGFGDVHKDFLIAHNTKTNQYQIIVPSGVNYELKQENGNDSIFGKFLSKRANKLEMPIGHPLGSTSHNYKAIMASMLALRLKNANRGITVSKVKVGELTGSDKKVRSHSMMELYPQTQILLKVLREGEEVSTEFARDYDDRYNDSDFQESTMSTLLSMIGEYTKPNSPFVLKNAQKSTIKDVKEHLVNFLEQSKNQPSLDDIFVGLSKALMSLEHSANQNENAKALYTQIALTISQLKGIDPSMNLGDEKLTPYLEEYRTGAMSNSPLRQALDAEAKTNEMTALRSYRDFLRQHEYKLQGLIDLARKKGLVGRVTAVQMDNEAIFGNLYINVDPSSDDYNPNDVHRLKPADDKSLAPEEKAYIEFFNKYIKEGFMRSANKSDLNEAAKEHKLSGWVPAMVQSSKTAKSEALTGNGGVKAWASEWMDRLKNGGRIEESDQDDYRFIKEPNEYFSQFKNGALGNSKRRYLLGMDTEGSNTDGKQGKAEKNLATILNEFFQVSVKKENHQKTLALKSAFDVVLQVQKLDGKSVETTQGLMDTWVKLMIFNRKKGNEEGGWKYVDQANKVLGNMALGFNPKQFTREFLTNGFISMNAVGREKFGEWFGVQSRFDAKSWFKAGSYYLNPVSTEEGKKADAVVESLGLARFDTEQWKQISNLTHENGVFQSKHAHHLNTKAFLAFSNQVQLAHLMKDGSFEAYTLEKDGSLTYDETKDPRFFIGDNPKTPEQIKKKAFYEAVKNKMRHEGILDPKGKMVQGYTQAEILDMKTYALKQFGSASKYDQSLASYHAFGRLMSKFKSWMAPKFDTYHHQTKKSLNQGHWVEYKDHEGNTQVRWEGDFSEGIAQTLGAMGSQLIEISKGSQKGLKLRPDQKRNLIKLTQDLMWMGISSSIALALLNGLTGDDDDKVDPYARLASTLITQATADMNMAGLIAGFAKGDSFSPVGLSYTYRLFNNAVDLAVAPMSGDMDRTTSALSKTVSSVGAFKAIMDIAEGVNNVGRIR